MDGGAARGGGRMVMAGPDRRFMNLAAAYMGALGTYRHACKAAKFMKLQCDLGGEVNENGAGWSGFGNGKGGNEEHILVRNPHLL